MASATDRLQTTPNKLNTISNSITATTTNSMRQPLHDTSNNYFASNDQPIASNSTTSVIKTPSKSKQINKQRSLITQTPPQSTLHESSNNIQNNDKDIQIFDVFATPFRDIHLDPTIISNLDQHNFVVKSSYLSPALSSPQNQHQLQLQQLHEKNKENQENHIHSLPLLPSSLESSKQQQPQQISTPTKKKKKSTDTNSNTSSTTFNLYSDDKPPYSYATLIGISILSHPNKRLTLSNIYQWISDTFKFYRKEDVGWQNSIRHNLSLNKAFIKGEKSKDGKGHFWCIKPGFEEQFLKSRSVKKSSYHEVMDQIHQATKLNEAAAAAKAIADAEMEKTKEKEVVEEEPKDEQEVKLPKDESKSKDKSIPKVKKLKVKLKDKNGEQKQIQTDVSLDKSVLLSSPTYNAIKRKRNDDEFPSNTSTSYQYDEEDITILDPPVKRFKSFKQQDDEDDNFLQLPWQSLNSPNSQLKLPPIYHLNSTPKRNNINSSSSSSTSSQSSRPNFVIDSPDKPVLAEKNLTYTSSFSCNSNFELSPLRTSETGPLLEPLTPANRSYKGHIQQQQQQQQQSQPHSHPHSHSQLQSQSTNNHQFQHQILQPQSQQSHHLTLLNKSKTPKSSSISSTTPLRTLKTPQTNSIMKRLWNSPSYLDDFYFSPLISKAHQTILSHQSNHTNNSNLQYHNNHLNSSYSSSSYSSLLSNNIHIATTSSTHLKLNNIMNNNHNKHNSGNQNLNSYDDDDMIMRNLNHPQLSIQSSPIIHNNNSNNELFKLNYY
ncbi:HCM1 [Candida pseudojiufengensis]|uniref:HCM1 n=1 Tax=Candida pseudojiufengensis TaxID=497109 RepID=UPI0022256F71|nr:HCM1 [Candida pseudojiufengensis]KAI5963506.1 HCM1 [Candida pseudojiufengensis]